MDATTCIHCNTTLTAADVSSGWCDSCGKRLPGGSRYVPAAKQPGADAPAPAAGKKGLAWGVALLALLAVGLASVVAFAH
jgi:hypothetical protein